MRIGYYFMLAFLLVPGLQQLHGGVRPPQTKVDLLRFVKRPGIVDTAKLVEFLKSGVVTSWAVKVKFDALDEHGWSIVHHLAVSAHKIEVPLSLVLYEALHAMWAEEHAALLNTQITATAGHPLVEIGDTMLHILPRLTKYRVVEVDELLTERIDYVGVDELLTESSDYADPNIKNSKGMTPIYEAIAHGNINHLRTLRHSYKADETLMSPLHVAAENAQFGMVYELLHVYEREHADKKVADYLVELNERGETVAQHVERLLEQYRAEIGVYNNEVEPLVGGDVLMVKELFLQGKSPMASPEEYRLIVSKVEDLKRIVSLLERAEEGDVHGYRY